MPKPRLRHVEQGPRGLAKKSRNWHSRPQRHEACRGQWKGRGILQVKYFYSTGIMPGLDLVELPFRLVQMTTAFRMGYVRRNRSPHRIAVALPSPLAANSKQINARNLYRRPTAYDESVGLDVMIHQRSPNAVRHRIWAFPTDKLRSALDGRSRRESLLFNPEGPGSPQEMTHAQPEPRTGCREHQAE